MATEIETLQKELAATRKRGDDLAARLAEANRVKGHLELANKQLLSRQDTLQTRLSVEQTESARLRQLVSEKTDNLSEARLAVSELKATLAMRSAEMERLRTERADNPVSNEELMRAFRLQREILQTLQDTLTCPCCLESIGKGEVISLACGHTFCEPCIVEWHRTSLAAKMRTPQSAFAPGRMVAAECPECRQDSLKGRVKIYALEEAVRVLGRYDPAAAFTEPDGAAHGDDM